MKRHPKNVPGNFFVDGDDCCTRCGVPDVVAPHLFGADEEQCFVKKQPESTRDFELMAVVLGAQEFDCIRAERPDPRLDAALARIDPPPTGFLRRLRWRFFGTRAWLG